VVRLLERRKAGLIIGQLPVRLPDVAECFGVRKREVGLDEDPGGGFVRLECLSAPTEKQEYRAPVVQDLPDPLVLADGPVALLGRAVGLERRLVAAHVLEATAQVLLHQRGQHVALVPRGGDHDLTRAVERVEDDLSGVQGLLVKPELEEHGHPAHVGSHGVEGHTAGHVSLVRLPGHAQCRVELAAREVGL
jgi:hypothetical protein